MRELGRLLMTGWRNIRGLAALAAQLASYVPAITDVTTALTRRASQLTSGAPGGWQGSAAAAFATSSHNDALAAAALDMATGRASQITGALAVVLSEIENALETETEAAVNHGVQIMPGGQPGPAAASASHASGLLYPLAQTGPESARSKPTDTPVGTCASTAIAGSISVGRVR